MWRPNGWFNEYLPDNNEHMCCFEPGHAFEAGADALLEALKHSKYSARVDFGQVAINIPQEESQRKGTLVFIPDEVES
jgi:hypothetical protein